MEKQTLTMMRRRHPVSHAALTIAAWLSVIPTALGTPAGAQTTDAPSFIVSPAWLHERVGQKEVVILHVGDKRGYEDGHVPGARWMWLDDVADAKATLHLQMPAASELEARFEALGVSDSSRIVLYFGKDQATPTARIFVALDYLGLGDRVSMLDGGLPAWKAAGYPVTTAVPTIVSGSLTPRPKPQVLADADWIAGHRTDQGVAIVDARLPQFYTGEDPGRFARPGRIAGARSLPFSSLLTDAGTFKPRADLERAFADAGVQPGDTVVSYCHIGQQASLVYLAARTLGHPARLYDGSFEEWSGRAELPVESGPRR